MKYFYSNYLLMTIFIIISGCTNSNDNKVYYMPVAVRHLNQFRLYIENIKQISNKYPVNTSVRVKNQYVYLLPSDYLDPNHPKIINMTGLDNYYSNDISKEPFRESESEFIQYISNETWFILISSGPDRSYEYQFIDEIENNKNKFSDNELLNIVNHFIYDPTNGALSRGDLIFSSENLGIVNNKRYAQKYRH